MNGIMEKFRSRFRFRKFPSEGEKKSEKFSVKIKRRLIPFLLTYWDQHDRRSVNFVVGNRALPSELIGFSFSPLFILPGSFKNEKGKSLGYGSEGIA